MAIDRKPWQRLLYEIWDVLVNGSSIEVESLSVTENGTYTAPEGKAYSPVTVSIGASGITELIPFKFTGMNTYFSAYIFLDDTPGNLITVIGEFYDDTFIYAMPGSYLAVVGDITDSWVVEVRNEDTVKSTITPTVTTYDEETVSMFQLPELTEQEIEDGYMVIMEYVD